MSPHLGWVAISVRWSAGARAAHRRPRRARIGSVLTGRFDVFERYGRTTENRRRFERESRRGLMTAAFGVVGSVWPIHHRTVGTDEEREHDQSGSALALARNEKG